MPNWLWSQISENGVFSIEALSKTVLAVVGLVSLGWNGIKWAKTKRAAKHAKLKLYRVAKKTALAITNCSETATARNVVVRWHTAADETYIACDEERKMGEMPPSHTKLLYLFDETFPSVEDVYITWEDKTGKHSSIPIEKDALPILHQE